MAALGRRFDPAIYVLWCAACTLTSACAFYGAMRLDTGGEWSAPLDDVFIHFDFARSTARGHPFEWVVGNGYSSGNTSLTYPFALAVGYLAGFRDLALMEWAAVVASVSVFGMLLAIRPLFFDRQGGPDDRWGRLSSYLGPPMAIGVGALAWSLWSGMEVAFFLGLWGAGLALLGSLDEGSDAHATRRAWALGGLGALLVATRPEAASTVLVFGVAAAGARRSAWFLVPTGAPAITTMAIQALANRALTGEWSPNGAVVKLAVNHPLFTTAEKLDDFVFNFRYAILRNVEYHFADVPAFGAVVPALALVALALPASRRPATLLWAQIVGWLLLVAFNGQVRWQNERYTMPAVAWLLVAAALGASALVRRARGRPLIGLLVVAGSALGWLLGHVAQPPITPIERALGGPLIAGGIIASGALLFYRPARLAIAGLLVSAAIVHQAPKMRDQVWFFARASKNIHDQHVAAGRWLAEIAPRRVLVGDAGALIYTSDRKGLDIIGLGGFHRVPFARAFLEGLGSTIELMEHLRVEDRPDVFAIFPSWWGPLPTWFSSRVLRRFPIDDNVICGDFETVVYEADWRLLGTGDSPRTMPDGDERVVDGVDIADLLSEREHAYRADPPTQAWPQLAQRNGAPDLHILPDPREPARDLLDAGRRIERGHGERFLLRGLRRNQRAHLVFRTAPEQSTRIRVRVGRTDLESVVLTPAQGWVENVIGLGEAAADPLEVEIENEGPGDFVHYHAWVTQ